MIKNISKTRTVTTITISQVSHTLLGGMWLSLLGGGQRIQQREAKSDRLKNDMACIL